MNNIFKFFFEQGRDGIFKKNAEWNKRFFLEKISNEGGKIFKIPKGNEGFLFSSSCSKKNLLEILDKPIGLEVINLG